MDNEVTLHGVDTAPHGVRRRALLGAGLGGAALSLLPFLSGRAAATDTTAATTTTAPPLRPTDADVEVLSALQRLELTALALYNDAIAAAKWSDAQSIAMATLAESHSAYSNSLAGLLGKVAPDAKSDAVYSQYKSAFSGSDVNSIITAAYDFESALVATHDEALGSLKGVNGAMLVASIQISEARHCTVLADLAGKSDLSSLLVDNEKAALQGNA